MIEVHAWVFSDVGGWWIYAAQVNNAGINVGPSGSDYNYDNTEAIVRTNYYGAKYVTDGLLPLLRASPAGARIVNVSSRLGLYDVSDRIMLIDMLS